MTRAPPLKGVTSLPSLEAAFRRIREDRRHGARALSTEALRELSRWVEAAAGLPRAEFVRRIRRASRILEQAQPAMGPFLKWSRELRELASSPSAVPLPSRVRSWLRREERRVGEEARLLLRVCRRRFPKVREVVTISRSSTVLLILSAVPRTRRPRRVSVLESLPGGEGRMFARDLRRAGFTVRVIPDRLGPETARRADLVIFGADAVFSDFSVAHKVGTRDLAKAATEGGVKVVVVAGRSKFTLGPPPRASLPAGFDLTPANYVSEFWTDKGIHRGGK